MKKAPEKKTRSLFKRNNKPEKKKIETPAQQKVTPQADISDATITGFQKTEVAETEKTPLPETQAHTPRRKTHPLVDRVYAKREKESK